MQLICGIYKITSPTNRIYIGQSIDIKKRIKSYRVESCKGQPLLFKSIKKYGWRKHKFEIIAQCDRSDLNSLERYYIELYDSFESEFGLNLTSGGAMPEVSLETRKRMSESGKGRVFSEEHKRKIGLAHKGKVISEEHKNKMRGRKFSDEHRKKIGLKSIGRTHMIGHIPSQETRKKISESNKGHLAWNRRSVIDTNTGIIYSCKKEAAIHLGIKERTLKAKLYGKLKNNTGVIFYSEYLTLQQTAGHNSPTVLANTYIHTSSKLIAMSYSPIDNLPIPQRLSA